MKRVIIVHGWDGYPEEGWFPWLKEELEKNGFQVFVPQLPEPEDPRIENWIPKLAEVVGEADKETYFVGHSMGCQAIARYLELLPENTKVGGAVFVGGFFKKLSGLGTVIDVKKTARHWLDAPIDLQKVKSHLNKSVAIFSDNDPFVPLDNQDDFRDKLGSEIIIEHKKGHFSDEFGRIKELPLVVESILNISK
ncbi:alpha/beta fold hydrolase [Candidatus Parcubacteria bacterium]|nr:alpha/beta fold hydrolase [Candidatus Parcubacteria bacterium]